MSDASVERGLPPLDLDAEPAAPRRPVKLQKDVYLLAGDDDLSLADKENLKLFFIRVMELREVGTAEHRLLTKVEEETLDDLERAICRIALPDAPASVIETLTPDKRNRLINTFFQTVDVRPYMQLAVRLQGLPERLRTAIASMPTTSDVSWPVSAAPTPDSSPSLSSPPTAE